MTHKQWFYRGNLKSCNYTCSYCPFSKKTDSPAKLEKDRINFFRFINQFEESDNLGGAVQIVPYGEALIHEYYWVGMAHLSRIQGIDAIGAQSNFSFPMEKMLSLFTQNGGQLNKLHLWGTFHPEMVSSADFLSQCRILSMQNVKYCVGAVGVPDNLQTIWHLREQLDPSTYLWLNKMDGLGRNYTKEEIEQFLAIDEYFELELRHHKADVRLCDNSVFVEADGTMHGCILCRQNMGNFYKNKISRSCSRKECSCYLAYSNRKEKELLFFQPYPAFRIPNYPKAIFFDVDGTLVESGQKQMSLELGKNITTLTKHCSIFLVTSLPLKHALRKTREIHKVLKGGVFANGGRCVVAENTGNFSRYAMDLIFPMETYWLSGLEKICRKYGCRSHIYEKEAQIYKVTLSFPAKKNCSIEKLAGQIATELAIPDTCMWFAEDNCIIFVRANRGKLPGILDIADNMGYSPDEIMVIGNSEQDIPMLEHFLLSVATKNSSEKVKKAAKFCL